LFIKLQLENSGSLLLKVFPFHKGSRYKFALRLSRHASFRLIKLEQHHTWCPQSQ